MKYPYGKIDRLSVSLVNNKVEKGIYDKIMKGGECIRQLNTNAEKSRWLLEAMKVMDANLEPTLKCKVREECACCLTGQRQIITKKIHTTYKTVNNRIDAANEAKYVFGNGVKEIGKGKYEVSFFKEEDMNKQCPCIKDLDDTMSITYCYCCGGHVKHHLQNVLGVPLNVKVVSSVLSSKGKKSCTFELTEV